MIVTEVHRALDAIPKCPSSEIKAFSYIQCQISCRTQHAYSYISPQKYWCVRLLGVTSDPAESVVQYTIYVPHYLSISEKFRIRNDFWPPGFGYGIPDLQ